MSLYILVGTRPNFIKVTRFKSVAANLFPIIEIQIIHTGQHYDTKMADVFFKQFGLRPDYFLNINPASPNRQIAEMMIKLEELCEKTGKPDMLLVPGDVNSTLAGALFANKNGIKLGHIEAGLRSYDRTMPEEFNRKLTDELCDLFFVTEKSGLENLAKEGHDMGKVHFVGNTMIDTMVAFEDQIRNSEVLQQFSLKKDEFVLMTMHRPATVDSKSEFSKLLALIEYLTDKYKVVFPIHPRTIKQAKGFGLHQRMLSNKGLVCTEPLDYFNFQKLICDCRFIVTDSGGIQEESTFRLKPCLTLRPNTERPVTIDIGTNTLLDFDLEKVKAVMRAIENGSYKKGAIPELWDGKATERILSIISKL